ncbi:hypothetical protein HanPI659440_Chr05g0207841 [Helianthus annuus]|nr:hypothetical protein HanPI659440_Chr05g0207841 [Helianthus annuus]
MPFIIGSTGTFNQLVGCSHKLLLHRVRYTWISKIHHNEWDVLCGQLGLCLNVAAD